MDPPPKEFKNSYSGKKSFSDSILKFGLIQKEERIITSSKVLVPRY